MKFLALLLTLSFSLLFSVSHSIAQVKNTELEKLETQLKRIETESNLVKVEVEGGNENSGKFNIIIEREVPVSAGVGIPTITGSIKTRKKKKTLPTIDLSKIEVSDEYIDEKIKDAFESNESKKTNCGVGLIQDGVSKNWIVENDYVYDSGVFSITVLKGFSYDRASIPRIFWAIIDKDSLGSVPPLLHDLLYRNGGILPTNQILPSSKKFSRIETDKLFLELMEKCGVSKVRRELAYQAVRKFGGIAWKGK